MVSQPSYAMTWLVELLFYLCLILSHWFLELTRVHQCVLDSLGIQFRIWSSVSVLASCFWACRFQEGTLHVQITYHLPSYFIVHVNTQCLAMLKAGPLFDQHLQESMLVLVRLALWPTFTCYGCGLLWMLASETFYHLMSRTFGSRPKWKLTAPIVYCGSLKFPISSV